MFGGVDRTDLSGDAPSNTKYKPNIGFAAGLVGEFAITEDVSLSLQPMWLQKGTKIAFAVPGEVEAVDSLRVEVAYLTFPLLVKLVSGNGKTYVSGGVDLGFLLDATISGAGEDADISSSFQRTEVAADVAFGVMLPIGVPRLTIEARYSQSITNVLQPRDGPEQYSLPPRARWSGLQLFAGVLYPFGGER